MPTADLIVFVAAGAVVWVAGTTLSRDADALAGATGLGRAFVGVVVLGVATSLPEIATTATAGAVGAPQLATGNLMGGVALQLVILAVADVVESARGLTFQVAKPVVLAQHVTLILLLGVAIAAMVVGEPVVVAGVGLWPLVLFGIFLLGVRMVSASEGEGRWHIVGPRPTKGRNASGADDEQPAPRSGDAPRRPPVWRLAAAGAAILGAGWAVARTGDRIAESGALSGTFVGAALVAAATSLPELSTVIGSLRSGAYDMAVSNIVGTNGLEVALLLVADAAYREGAIIDVATRSDIFLAALGVVLTCIYLGGLVLRSQRTVLRVGYDSAAVVVVYVGGLVVLAVLG